MIDSNIKLTKIFLSHSSNDQNLATTVSESIEREFDNVKVYCSSRPNAIEAGDKWFNSVVDNLNSCDVFVFLFTPQASASLWVGFEVGYAWRKFSEAEKKIFPLYLPPAEVPNVLNQIQAKSVTNKEGLESFFHVLSKTIAIPRKSVADLQSIIDEAAKVPKKHSEKSPEYFYALLDMPDKWREVYSGGIQIWQYKDNTDYTIQQMDFDSTEDFDEEWLNKFPNYNPSSRYTIHLKIGQNVIDEIFYISIWSARFFVPMPEMVFENDKMTFIWDMNSPRCKLIPIIGTFYKTHPDIGAFANYCGIKIIN